MIEAVGAFLALAYAVFTYYTDNLKQKERRDAKIDEELVALDTDDVAVRLSDGFDRVREKNRGNP